ncbi:MAG TPA: PQQ-binding-like beta-propeller repeat protein [Trueperaceae bacterium]
MKKSIVAVILALFLGACFAQLEPWQSITEEFLTNPPASAWPSKRRTPNSWGYSPLDQINTENVSDLELAWSIDTGVAGQVEWTPVVANGRMFLQAGATRIMAMDAATGDLLWTYEYEMLPAEERAELGVGGSSTSRGLTLFQDMVIGHFGDSHIVAVDAETGQEVWKTFTDGGGYTSPGIIADGVLISGNSAKGYDRAFVTGTDPESGEVLWKTYMIPGPGEPGYETWEVEGTAEVGHASAWMTPSYDPELNLVYVGTGNPDPYTPQSRPGDNLYTGSILALDPQTGEIVWYHQVMPNDSWDLGSVMETILVDLEIDGETVPALLHTNKGGFLNILNRETGEYIDHTFVVYQNVIESVDPETGRPTYNEEVIPHPGERVIACPSTRGGTDWPARAYSPETNLYYLSGNHVCMDVEGFAWSDGMPMRNIDDIRVVAEGYEDRIGELFAFHADTLEPAWSVEFELPTTAIPLPTAGGLVFAGHTDRFFRAYDAETGEELWGARLTGPIEGHPISYAVDGTQYVAVPAGCCSLVGSAMLRDFAPEALGPAGTGSIFVFKLDND